jgi:oxygen-independent coproporphyrinogen-3 oxidase
MNALCKEVEYTSKSVPDHTEVHTIYFGGGTPSLIPIDLLKSAISTVQKIFLFTPDIEITLEANPGSITPQYMKDLHLAGFTRVSMGLQSIHESELKILDRKHDFTDAKNGVSWAKDAGFEHISLDLIFGIPGQTMSTWKETIKSVIDLPVDHLSLYSLNVEDGTPLQKQIQSGQVQPPDEDLAGDMYQYALSDLPDAGFEQYEISNWARSPKAYSKHNIQYWTCDPYLGFGAGAHGYIAHTRYENAAGIIPYIHLVEKSTTKQDGQFPASIKSQLLDPWDEMQEFMMLGLRLTNQGISKADFQKRFSIPIGEVFSHQIGKLCHLNLIENYSEDNDRIRLTQKGVIYGNRVFSEFVGNKKPKILMNQ